LRAPVLYAAVFLAAFALYALTTQGSAGWQDSGIYQCRILDFDFEEEQGLARCHPLLIVLGKAISIVVPGPEAWAINLVSALCGAIAVANIALLTRRLVPHTPSVTFLAAGMLLVSHTTWWLATICESQCVFLAIFTGQLLAAHWFLSTRSGKSALLLGALGGVGVLAHNLALLALPGAAVLVIERCKRGDAGWTCTIRWLAGCILGALPYMVMIAARAAETGPAEAVGSALFGRSWQGAVLGASARATAMGLGYVAFNFPNLAIPLCATGLFSTKRLLRKPMRYFLIYLLVIYFLFAVRYRVPDQFMFFLPFYAVVVVFAAAGAGRLSRGRSWAVWRSAIAFTIVLTPVFYHFAPDFVKAFRMPLPGRRDLPREHARYWLVPWKHDEDSAGVFARQALEEAGGGGIIIADSTSYWPLLFERKTNPHPDRDATLLKTGEATPGKIAAGRDNVFTTSGVKGYYPRWLDGRADLVAPGPYSVLCKVGWRSPATRAAGDK
jgi:hypothetical protein